MFFPSIPLFAGDGKTIAQKINSSGWEGNGDETLSFGGCGAKHAVRRAGQAEGVFAAVWVLRGSHRARARGVWMGRRDSVPGMRAVFG